MKNAAVYSANPKLLDHSLLSSIDGIGSLRLDSQNDRAVLEGTIDGNRFQINVMSNPEVGPHLQEFRRYIESYHAKQPIDNLDELLTYVNSICCVYGMVFSCEFDFDSVIWRFIKETATLVDGVIFICDSLVDTEDLVIFGPLGDD